jgi:hypothetical protein
MFILAVVLFWPASIGGKVLSAGDIPLFSAPFPSQGAAIGPKNGLQFDAANVFEPDGLLVRAALRDGRLPVWASQLSNGRPLLAAQQSAPLFPLTWIGVVFPFFSALVWIAILKIAIAGFGTFVLARALGLRRASAFVGAITFGFGTYLVVWLMHPHSNAYVLLPWLFLTAERLCRGGRVRDAAALGGLLGLSYLGGQPESGLIVSLATASWTVYQLWVADVLRRDLARRIALAAAAVVLGVAIAAVMLAPPARGPTSVLQRLASRTTALAQDSPESVLPTSGVGRINLGRFSDRRTTPNAPSTLGYCPRFLRRPACLLGARAGRSSSSPLWFSPPSPSRSTTR